MKKRYVILLLALIVLGQSQLFAVSMGHSSLYGITVPVSYDQFIITGNTSNGLWGDDAVYFRLPMSGTAEFQMGLDAEYEYVTQTEDTYQRLGGSGSVEFGTGLKGIEVDSDGPLIYKIYGMDFSGYDGFITYGGTADADIYSTSTMLDAAPYIGAGIGRIRNISNIILAELMLEYMGIEAAEETVRRTAEILSKRSEYAALFTADNAERKLAYWNDLAEAMGAKGRELEVAFLDNNQSFAFERARYTDLHYGWEIGAKVVLNPSYASWRASPKFNFDGNLVLDAEFDGFLMDNDLYYSAQAVLKPAGYEYSSSGGFYLHAGASGELRYFPEDYHWRFDGSADINAALISGSQFTLTLNAAANYLINPNFTTFAAVKISDSRGFELGAGGAITLW
ncbi:MAG: hypothetical protein K9K78_02660 [Spirochaetales bacterium]|nr:hypothetical protein [Spirochaetales bacterium]